MWTLCHHTPMHISTALGFSFTSQKSTSQWQWQWQAIHLAVVVLAPGPRGGCCPACPGRDGARGPGTTVPFGNVVKRRRFPTSAFSLNGFLPANCTVTRSGQRKVGPCKHSLWPTRRILLTQRHRAFYSTREAETHKSVQQTNASCI
ncbi:hypothetical protein B0T17DRAFT_360958 [Bombardia bombarda]|uniref:Uncharacterized protein n=1 Tax=Bombardia bombarda TaxID=252184 RepID=A0AA39WIC1_9PEZI|nr:hypothetical protein B0T17DRAFT_360958 [Bombardia bombarda]